MRKLLCTWKFELKLCFVIVQNSSAVFKFLFKGQWNRPRLNYCYYCSVDQSCQIPWDPKDCSTPGFPVLQHLSGLAQTHVHWWVDDAIQPSYPLSSPSPPAFSLAQHQGLFQWVRSSHQVDTVLELQLQYQSFQWIVRTDFLEDWLAGSPCCPRDSQESTPTPQLKSINSSMLSFLYSSTLTTIYDYWIHHSFD